MMRWETHCHTNEGSACGRAAAAEMASACKAAGYDGLFVTDHFYNGNTAVDRTLPWEEWVRQFCLGYEHAKETGERIGLRVCFGWEYSWEGNDFLTYGLSPAWLTAHPEIVLLEPIKYLRLVRGAGGFVVHAHPFRQEAYVKYIKLLPDEVDAAEVFNFGNRDDRFNQRAKWYAESFGLPQTSGSDAHSPDAFGGGIITPEEIVTAEDYARVIRSGAYELIGT
ncbi:MAG: PHP domain-containing protein [Oscillospiraceae bacterium]|nr:PHP domain-containing protein [Oscillospiraceae bacterium]